MSNVRITPAERAAALAYLRELGDADPLVTRVMLVARAVSAALRGLGA